MTEKQFLLAYDRKRTSTLTLDSEPGAHAGTTRQYIPGYSDSNIIFRAPTTGNDANDGLTEGAPKQTKAACDTAAGTTKKIRIIEACSLNESVSKPTEMKRGVSGTISSSLTAPVNVWTQAGTPALGADSAFCVAWFAKVSRFIAAGDAGKIVYSTDADTWTAAATPSFGSTRVRSLAVSDSLGLIVAVATGKIGYSLDGNTWKQVSVPLLSTTIWRAVVWHKAKSAFIAVSIDGDVIKSEDGISWKELSRVSFGSATSVNAACVSQRLGRIYVAGDDSVNGKASYSADGVVWTACTISTSPIQSIIDAESMGKVIAVSTLGAIRYSASGESFSSALTPGFGTDIIQCVGVDTETGTAFAADNNGTVNYSADADTWTAAATPSFGTSAIYAAAYSPLLGKSVLVGAAKIAYSTAFANTISANVAGFTIQAVQYSGTITAYNCTMKQPGTTAALTLNACRVTEAGSHISSNTAGSFATLFEGDRHTTCTPAAQNDIDCNLDTVGGTWYIYNASATGFERIRDCLVTGGVIANFNVAVSGRANIQGDSENILIDAEVTTDDPKFVDTTDYKLQFQTNGYARNSLAAGRSAIYFNSAGSPRDIGAWSYVESAISYYFAKSAVLYKGQITHATERVTTEQQGDSGVITVFGNKNRVKEILTIEYGPTKELDRAPFEYLDTIDDKGVKLIIDAEWESNAGTVTVNGNQSAGAEFLTVDSCIYYNGMWVTVAGKRYWIMRASPSNTAATKLILDRPLEDAVSDNDVLVTNYPPGVGEFQYSGIQQIQLKRIAPDGLVGWQTGFQIRFVRKKQ